MKKLLLLLLVIGFSVSTFAQVAGLKQQTKFKTAKALKQMPVKDQAAVYQGDVNPYVANDRDQDIVIGTTWYDMQSNSSLDHRFYIFDDGTMGATWIFASEGGSFPDRGTGYNYFDGADWGTFSGVRIDPERTGWPTYQPYGENGEIVCAHTGASGLVFSYRETKGEGEWQSFYLYGPASTGGLVWPRMITTGENHDVIHVIASLFNEDYEGIHSPVIYYRSSDGGQTWDIEDAILDGLDSDHFKRIGGDDYAWAEPNNGTIAFVVFNGVCDGVIMQSEDDGDSWESTTFYESPYPFYNDDVTFPETGGGDGANAIAIGDDGVIHVAFGRQIHSEDNPGDNVWSYYIYSDGLVYWNTTMEPLDSAQITSDIIPEDWSTLPIYQNGQLAAWTQPHGDDTIVGVATYQLSLTGMPQMIIHGGVVQIIYGGLAVGFDNEEYNYRHIMGRYTDAVDGSWGDFEDYTRDVFHLLNESVYPVAAPQLYGGNIHIIYQTDNLPGDALQPSGGTYPAHENNMVYMPIGFAVGVNEQVAEANFEVSQNYPNPATDQTMIMVTTETTGQINLTLSNVLGQIVYRTSENANHMGSNAFKLNVANLDAGIYFYTIEMGNKSVTKKMIVK